MVGHLANIKLIKREGGSPNLKQYPLRQEDKKESQTILKKFLKIGLTKPCRYPYKTPILLVKKSNSAEYLFVQTWGLLMK